jgi:hypothetical protein
MKAIISKGTGNKDGRITAYITETKIVAYLQETKTIKVVNLDAKENAVLREDDATKMTVSQFIDCVLKYQQFFKDK